MFEDSFRPQTVHNKASERILRVAFDIDSVIQIALHLLVVLLELSLIVQLHRAVESLLNDSDRYLAIISDVQLVKSLIDAVF